MCLYTYMCVYIWFIWCFLCHCLQGELGSYPRSVWTNGSEASQVARAITMAMKLAASQPQQALNWQEMQEHFRLLNGKVCKLRSPAVGPLQQWISTLELMEGMPQLKECSSEFAQALLRHAEIHDLLALVSLTPGCSIVKTITSRVWRHLLVRKKWHVTSKFESSALTHEGYTNMKGPPLYVISELHAPFFNRGNHSLRGLSAPSSWSVHDRPANNTTVTTLPQWSEQSCWTASENVWTTTA